MADDNPWLSYDPGESGGDSPYVAAPVSYSTGPWADYGPGEGAGADTPEASYSNEGRNYPTPESTQGAGGSPFNASSASDWERFVNSLKGYGALGKGASGLLDMLGAKGSLAGLMALLSAIDRQKATGGGTGKAYAGPGIVPQRTIVQGKYGPIAKYAAEGGLMHAYAGGGPVAMEDGGFVMTKKAVDGAGGADGIRQLIPGARMIRGPGTGTSDSIPAVINSPRGQTPAALSNGEAYVPKRAVQDQGGARKLYALMHNLQRRA